MLFQAIEFATEAHRGQLRKVSGIPYIYHPLAVAKILMAHDCCEEIVVAGVLHDTVEDTPVTLDQIRQSFGERVASLVEGLSEPNKLAEWEERKQHKIRYLSDAPVDVLIAACADKLDNVRSLEEDLAKKGDVIWKRFKRPKPHQAWYYQSLVDVLSRRAKQEPLISLVQELSDVVGRVF